MPVAQSIAFDDQGEAVQTVGFDYDAVAREVDGEQDEPEQGHAAIEHLERAFEAGREQGRAEGQREVLARLFHRAQTSTQIVERAAAMAFAATWPDDTPCPLNASDLASFTGVSRRTAERRVQKAKLSHSFPDKHCSECASVSPPPYW